MSKPFYITTAIAYANSAPHIGHAFEFVTGDTIARYQKLIGSDVYFVTGMDEHGQKIEQKAKDENITPQELVDKNANLFKALDKELSINYDFFVRTSDKELHYKGATTLWNRLVDAGTIEKKAYKALYCIGCEEFKRDSDLNEEGLCAIHLTKPDVVEEENYFFKLSQYTNVIKEKILSNELEIIPDTRRNEILALLDRGLEDVSFSRPKSKVSWGIPVPNDDEQVMYVWCDALSNYITAIGYGTEHFKKELWGNTTHLIGKDISRFHAAIWPGMLLAAGLPLPKRILVHGFITSGGHKMSKTLGNVIDPQDLLEMFRVSSGELAGDALRFVLLHEIPSFADGDMTLDTIKASYTAHLANGIGNLTSRIMKMATTHLEEGIRPEPFIFPGDYTNAFNCYDTKKAIEFVMKEINSLDGFIQESEPFKVIKVDIVKGKSLIEEMRVRLYNIARLLQPFMPDTSDKVKSCVKNHTMPEKPLFNRLS